MLWRLLTPKAPGRSSLSRAEMRHSAVGKLAGQVFRDLGILRG